jgi:gluconokinase
MVVLLMGVSGCGKTTIGRAVAKQLNAAFIDADDYHSESNIEKMRAGRPLNDEDRQPWLKALCSQLDSMRQEDRLVVLACSALSKASRAQLRSAAPDMTVVWLHGPRELIAERMRGRKHFMPERLLDSQYETLERPEDALELAVSSSPKELTKVVCQHVAAERQSAPPRKIQ